jgi:hypothetical protein
MNASELGVSGGDGGFVLTSSSFEHLPTAADVYEASRRTLATLNGIARVAGLLSQPIEGNEVLEQRDGATKSHQFVEVPTITLTARVFAPTVTGSDDPIPTPATSLGAEISLKDANVARALALFAQEPSWVTLYQVIDVLEEDLGGEPELAAKRWVPPAELKRFAHTANNYQAVGPSARHARVGWQAPSRPMTLREAAEMIRTLLRAWLAEKASTS